MGFIRLTSLLIIWAVWPPPAMVAAAWPPHLPFDSLHQTRTVMNRFDSIHNNAVSYDYESRSVEDRRKRAPPPPHGIKKIKVKHRRKKDKNKNKFKSARTVGYFFAGIALLIQVAVVVFLLIKRKQMIGVVHKYDEAPPEWNGIHV